MINSPAKFRFHVLVLEDNPDLVPQMRSALGTIFKGLPVSFDIVGTSNDAFDQFRAKRRHFISLDKNVPEQRGGEVLPQHGFTAMHKIQTENRTTKVVVYTGYSDTASALDARDLGIDYWIKGSDPSLTEELKPKAKNVVQWAQSIAAFLQEDYERYTLRRLGTLLPGRAGYRASEIASALEAHDHQKALRMYVELWETALAMMYVQSLALAKHARQSIRRREPLGTLASTIETIERLLNSLGRRSDAKSASKSSEPDWVQPWRRTIDMADGSDMSTGAAFLKGACSPFRELRNLVAHSFDVDDHDMKLESLRDSRLFLLDALSHWAENPWITALEFVRSDDRRLKMRSLVGNLDHMPDGIIENPGFHQLPEGSARSAPYLFWKNPTGRDVLVSLEPFARLQRDGARVDLLLFSRPGRISNRWIYRLLSDGREVELPVASNDVAALGQVLTI